MLAQDDLNLHILCMFEDIFFVCYGPSDDIFRSDSVKEMYTTHSELEYMVTSLEKKEETLSQVESGKIPDPPVVSQTPVDTKEPEVVTVQVG